MNEQEHDPVEELVAYLDGELAPAASRQVDERLASDPKVQAEVHRLELAWDLLDELPRAEVDDAFTRTTVEMVVLAASQELAAQAAEQPKRRRKQWLTVGGGLLAASLAGFLAIRLFSSDPNEPLLKDLRVCQDLDPYRQAGDIEFLRLLKEEGVFAEEVTDAP